MFLLHNFNFLFFVFPSVVFLLISRHTLDALSTCPRNTILTEANGSGYGKIQMTVKCVPNKKNQIRPVLISCEGKEYSSGITNGNKRWLKLGNVDYGCYIKDAKFGIYLAACYYGNVRIPLGYMYSTNSKLYRCDADGLKVINCISYYFSLIPPGKKVTEYGVTSKCTRTPGRGLIREIKFKNPTLCNPDGLKKVIYVIDASRSITSPGFQSFKTAVHNSITRLPTKTTIYVYVYSDNVRNLAANVLSATYDGQGTQTGKAMQHVASAGHNKSVIILLTDGDNTDTDTSKLPKAIALLTSRGNKIVTVAVGNEISQSVLDEIGTETQVVDNTINVGSPGFVHAVDAQVTEAIYRGNIDSCFGKPWASNNQKCLYWALNDEPMRIDDIPAQSRCPAKIKYRNIKLVPENLRWKLPSGFSIDKACFLRGPFAKYNCKVGHKGAAICIRSKLFAKSYKLQGKQKSGNQCCYKKSGHLLTTMEGGGTVDKARFLSYSSDNGFSLSHDKHDVKPYKWCKGGLMPLYLMHRPIDGRWGN